MNVEICFLTNACQAGLPNLTKFNQTVYLADKSRRRKREKEEEGKYAGHMMESGKILMNLLNTLF